MKRPSPCSLYHHRGKFDLEHGAAIRRVVRRDGAPVLGYDSVSDGQPESRPFADVLGREERIEDLRQDVRGDARTVIADRYDDQLARLARRRADVDAARAARRYRVLGVDDHVQKRLLEVRRGARHGWKALARAPDDLPAGLREMRLAAGERAREHAVDLRFLPRDPVRAGEHEQVAHDLRGAVRLLVDLLQLLL